LDVAERISGGTAGTLQAASCLPVAFGGASSRHAAGQVATTEHYTQDVPARPTSVRLDPALQRRISAFAARHPGMSVSGAISLLVDEGLRMHAHPAVVFRDGPLGRRAGLVAGPDVWEVIRSVRASREVEPDLSEDRRIARNAGLTAAQVKDAVRYYTDHPDEVDRMIADAAAADAAAQASAARRSELLG
jgi:hypothetical protein